MSDVYRHGAVQRVYTDGEYAKALNRELAERDGNIYCHNGCEGDERYLLVEKSRFDGELCLTTHVNADHAAEYHDNQEYPEDWPVEALIDLETGLELSPTTTTTFEPKENG